MYTRIAPLLPFIEQFITGWSAWTAWSDCAAECGKSKKYRARVCETYKEGTKCEGNAVEYVDCYQARCPTWAEWTQWTQCAPSCGDGQRVRTRLCSAGGGPSDLAKPKYCQGPQQQQEVCTGQPCKPYWDYSEWGMCGCDSMFVTRRKECMKRRSQNAIVHLPDHECTGLPHEPLIQQCSAPVNPEKCKEWVHTPLPCSFLLGVVWIYLTGAHHRWHQNGSTDTRCCVHSKCIEEKWQYWDFQPCQAMGPQSSCHGQPCFSLWR